MPDQAGSIYIQPRFLFAESNSVTFDMLSED
jgi:hypothetical protein